MTQKAFTAHLGWTYARLNEVVNGRRQVNADSALALGEALKTGPEFWLNLQRAWDLRHAMDSHRKVPPLNKGGIAISGRIGHARRMYRWRCLG